MRENLVIVRAGNASLHRNWLKQPYSCRSFDLVVSYYEEDAFRRHYAEDGVTAVFYPGGKWDGLYKTISSIRDRINLYEYFWLPDDDIETDGETINKMFALMDQHKIRVGQPSLTLDSYFTHFIFLQCSSLELRRTNFIEVMVPCLSLEVLNAIQPEFQHTLSGFGLDYIWCRIPQCGRDGAAIIDAVSVRHTRPIGKVLATKMREIGVDPKEEEAKLASCYGITTRITPIAYSATTKAHLEVKGKCRAGLLMAFDYSKSLMRKSSIVPSYNAHSIFRLLRRQLTRKVDLSELRSRRSERTE